MPTRTQGKKWWPHKKLGQNYLLVLEGLQWRWGMAVAHCRDKNGSGRSSGEYSLVWDPMEAAIFSPRPGSTQQPVGSCLDASCQTTNKAGAQPHSTADRLLKFSLNKQLPDKHTPWQDPVPQRDKTQLHPAVGGELVPPTRKPAQAS